MSEGIKQVPTRPYKDQVPGTSGLRKKTRVFMDNANYAENFIQSVFNTLNDETGTDISNEALCVGGDGRYLNHEILQTILKMAVANGFGTVYVPRDGLISTPAMSAVIRQRGALGGFILTASHNPGGADGDFGIKYNVRNGGPAPETFTENIYKHSLSIDNYKTLGDFEFEIGKETEYKVLGTTITVIDPFTDYENVLRGIFNFDKLSSLFKTGFEMVFDAMHGVTGIYGKYFLEHVLGAPEGTVVRGEPLPDFGGIHPDPNLVYNSYLVDIMSSDKAPDFGAANDGDGDRNMVFGRGLFIPPGDSLSVITDLAREAIPGFKDGIKGVARSMPTSTSVDRVAGKLGIDCYETPTGWKFFGNLMDAGLCSICGEESFGTGADHVREKDGLWAVLSWLSIIEHTGKSAREILSDHWKKYGRSYYERHDYEEIDKDGANELFAEMRKRLPDLIGEEMGSSRIAEADEFRYVDPVSGDVSEKQGLRFKLTDGSRAVARLSGTGTKGATIRFYLEQYDSEETERDTDKVLEKLSDSIIRLFEIEERFGRKKPTLIT
jgi:phosphoglucomutase